MSLDHILIRPRILERFAVDDLQVGDVVTELFSRLSIDVARQANGSDEASSLNKIEKAASLVLHELNQDIMPLVQQAGPKILTWFKPLEDAIQQAITAIGNPQDAETVLHSFTAFLEWLAATLGKLKTSVIVQAIRELINIIEKDLNFTIERFGTFLHSLVEDVIKELTAEYLAGTHTENAKKDFLIGSHIAWLRRYYQNDFPINLSSVRLSDLVELLSLEFPKTDWDRLAIRMAQFFRDLARIARSLSGQFSISVTVNANHPQHERLISRSISEPQISWYASWLKEQMAEGEFPIEMEPETWEEVLSFFTVLEEYVFVKDRFKPEDEPFGTQIATEGVSYEFQEVWTWLAAVLKELMEVIFMSTSYKEGSPVFNGIDIVLKSIQGLYTLINGFGQKGEAWVRSQQGIGIVNKSWDYAIKPLLEMILEKGVPTNSDHFFPGIGEKIKKAWRKYVTNLHLFTAPLSYEGKDVLKNLLELHVQDLALSIMTLSNARKADAGTMHHRATKGVIAFTRYLGYFLGALANSIPLEPVFGGKRHFGFPQGAHIARFFLTNILFCGFGFSLMFTFPGYWIASALSGRDTMNKEGIATEILKDVLKSYLEWMAFYIFWWDGAGQGKWGIDPNNQIIQFNGYPDPANAPYELPFAKHEGELVECIQGPHGFWSHNSWTNCLYAVDFKMEYGQEVLAMRGGTVVDYEDIWPDIHNGKWNYITIRHDDATEGALPNPIHDLGPGGILSTTYATYGHGRHFGVRHAFAARGITPEQIIGTTIKKGEAIMLVGDTGQDAIEAQVHVHVKASVLPDAPTIPFVFKNLPGKGLLRKAPPGVPKTNSFYSSNNEKQTVVLNHGLIQPNRQEGFVLHSGSEEDGRRYVVLDRFANPLESSYKGAHIHITFEDQGQPYFLYKKIVEYNNGDRKAYLDGDWDTPILPPPGSTYRIGGMPRDEKDEFGQHFAYLAKSSDNPWTPYKLA